MRVALVTLVASLVVLSASASSAQVSNHSASTLVRVSLVGRAYSAELEELLKEWFSAQGLRVSVARQRSVALEHLLQASDRSEVRAWLVLPTKSQARVYFADTQSQRFFVRDVPLESGLDELGREKLAQVVVASAQAFSERQVDDTPLESVKEALAQTPEADPGSEAPSGATPATAPRAPAPERVPVEAPQAHEPEPPSSNSRGMSWALATGYVGVYRGPEGIGHGPVLSLEGWLAGEALALGLAAGARYELPHTATAPELDLRLQTTQLRLGLFAGPANLARPSWVLGTGLASDWFEFRPVRPAAGVAPRASARDRRTLVFVALGRFWSFDALRLGILAGADLSLEKSHYDVLLGNEPRRVLTPWQVHPNVSLQVGWH